MQSDKHVTHENPINSTQQLQRLVTRTLMASENNHKVTERGTKIQLQQPLFPTREEHDPTNFCRSFSINARIDQVLRNHAATMHQLQVTKVPT